MTNFTLINRNISTIFDSWNAFSTSEKQQKINLILPFVQFASFLNHINHNQNLEVILQNFALDYQNIFGQNLQQMAQSDLPDSLLEKIAASQANQQPIDATTRQEILPFQDKYIHAHNRVMFNYGEFLATAEQNLSSAQQQIIATKIASFDQVESALQLLQELNAAYLLEQNSALIEKDDLENHALLNQLTNYNQNIAQLGAILLDEKLSNQAVEFLRSHHHKTAIKRQSTTPNLADFATKLADKNLEMTVGLESEFLLNSLSQNQQIQDSATRQNIAIKKAVADITARRNMQKKYGFEPTLPEITNVTLLLNENADFSEVIGRKDYLIIQRAVDDLVSSPNKRTEIMAHVNNFAESEAFFFKLLFVEDFAYQHKIEIDGIFDYKKSKSENLQNVVPFIVTDRFYEKLLDMIQAYEIAIGPFAVDEIIEQKNQAFSKLRLLANQSQLSLDDANVQVNSSFFLTDSKNVKHNILLPEIKEIAGETVIQFNQLGAQILEIMQEAVSDLGNVSGVLRQSEIASGLDRNKHVKSQLENTAFRQVDAALPAFLNHKFLAAKNIPLRLSFINDEVAVVELRLVGNNTHFAQFDQSQNIYHSGIDFIAEEFLQKFSTRFSHFLESKNSEEITALYNQKITIDHGGKIVGLSEIITPQVSADHNYDHQSQTVYKPEKPALSVAIIPFTAAQPLLVSSNQNQIN